MPLSATKTQIDELTATKPTRAALKNFVSNFSSMNNKEAYL